MSSIDLITICALILCATACAAREHVVYTCPKVSPAPAIDGVLDDEAWARCPVVTLVDAQTGGPVTRKTTARMCWDDEYLYVGFECEDTDIWGTLTNRDDLIFQEEVVEVFIAPGGDLVRYLEFNVSPRNVVFDAFIVNPDGMNPNEETSFGWNCEGIRTAVAVDGTLDDRTDTDRGWTAEIAIPFAGLDRPSPRPGERWRLNLYRIDLTPPPAEFQAWSPTLCTPARFHVPDRFGTVFFSAAE